MKGGREKGEGREMDVVLCGGVGLSFIAFTKGDEKDESPLALHFF